MRCPHCRQFMPRPHMPRNAFKPWNRGLDMELTHQSQLYRRMDIPVEKAVIHLANYFERSENSIFCRLRKLDLITE